MSDKRVVHSSDFAVLKSVQGRPIAAGIKAKDKVKFMLKKEKTLECKAIVDFDGLNAIVDILLMILILVGPIQVDIRELNHPK